MYPVNFAITDHVIKQLSQLLDLELSHVQLGVQEGVSSTTLHLVSAFDSTQTRHRLILKQQQDHSAFRFYMHYLQPFKLNSPREYGYIDSDGQAFLVMDYIPHATPNWSDSNGYIKAVQWLTRKDLVTVHHLDSLRNLDCFGRMEYYGVPYWLAELEQLSKVSAPNSQIRQIVRTIRANQTRIDTYIEELNSAGAQTVVHGDLHLSNVLFGEGDHASELFVIDWTEPHIGSVTKDLASLYDNAPRAIKAELIKLYRSEIDFPGFDELFAKARLLRDIGYLSWMAGMISAKAQQEIDQNELERVMQSIILSLG